MKPRRTSLRVSLHQFAEDFIDGVLDALRAAPFVEFEALGTPLGRASSSALPRAPRRGRSSSPRPLSPS